MAISHSTPHAIKSTSSMHPILSHCEEFGFACELMGNGIAVDGARRGRQGESWPFLNRIDDLTDAAQLSLDPLFPVACKRGCHFARS